MPEVALGDARDLRQTGSGVVQRQQAIGTDCVQGREPFLGLQFSTEHLAHAIVDVVDGVEPTDAVALRRRDIGASDRIAIGRVREVDARSGGQRSPEALTRVDLYELEAAVASVTLELHV
jgi:hypothetical protein